MPFEVPARTASVSRVAFRDGIADGIAFGPSASVLVETSEQDAADAADSRVWGGGPSLRRLLGPQACPPLSHGPHFCPAGQSLFCGRHYRNSDS
jgi:hypothetical protein